MWARVSPLPPRGRVGCAAAVCGADHGRAGGGEDAERIPRHRPRLRAAQGMGARLLVVLLVPLLVPGLFLQEHRTHQGLGDAASTSLAWLGGSASFRPVLTPRFKVQPRCCTLPPPITYL